MKRRAALLAGLFLFALSVSFVCAADGADSGLQHKLIDIMSKELDHSMKHLATDDGQKPYYLAYTITGIQTVSIRGGMGALYSDNSDHSRILDVDVRIGSYELDSTHQIRGGRGGRGMSRLFGGGAAAVSLEDNEEAVRHAIWRATDSAFKSAVERYKQVLTNVKTMVDEEHQVDDFSREEPSTGCEEETTLALDRDEWAQRIARVSALAAEYPLIHDSSVSLSATAEDRFMVSSEGTKLRTGRKLLRVIVSASTRAEDGMDLSQSFIFDAAAEEGLPSEDAVQDAFKKVIDQVLAMRDAPLVEPYVGPAILLNRASGVFFHEIFGHRIEGHRQKDVEEGQTFTKMIGKPVLPGFMSVYDDPTRATFEGADLRGYYRYDDEGVPASRVDLVVNGILKTFLLSRSPVEGFSSSNGHGRRQPGRSTVSRQGNLIIASDRTVTFDELRARLVEECKKQEKPFGFLFEDITGGFTTTQRSGPQAFKVLPVVVYKVFADGRPDQLVRGVDIVGTPLSCFSKILCTGDDPAVFNGSCGAESGSVPVSAVSPSILVEQIEIEKRQRSQERLPILPPPKADPGGEDEDPLLNALEDELARSMTLQLEDLEKPYFVQYAVDDTTAHRLSATCGAIISSDRSRSRLLTPQVRVGSYELDNTNFGGGGMGGFGRRGGGGGRPRGGMGGRGATPLPIDGNEMAIRHDIWSATDSVYKSAVETLAQKRAYIEDRGIEDRPHDFAAQEPVKAVEPLAGLADGDLAGWEDKLKRISARFLDFDFIQSGTASLSASARNSYLVNTEGTRLREGETLASLRISANVQAEDGERISDSIEIFASNPGALPAVDAIIQRVDGLVARLSSAMAAPVLDEYFGPVLFDEVAAPQLFQELLSRGLAASSGQVGGGRRRVSASEDMSKYLGKRILPRSFQVHDDPSAPLLDGTLLTGHYTLDDEGVPARRVELVVDGTLKEMLTCRTPTKDFKISNGHGRLGRGAAQASVGCLYISSKEGLSPEELKKELIEAAVDQGLDYALRIVSLRARGGGGMGSMEDMRAMFARMQRGGGGGGSALSDPLVFYKVHVEDGREEPVRSCEFGEISVSDLRKIAAAGSAATVYNRGDQGAGSSIIAPAVLFEELELFGIEQEQTPKPYITAPHAR